MKKKISIVTPTYNEDQNIEKLIFEIKKIMDSLQSKYDYEHIVIDNRSTDNTINILKKIAKEDKNLKIIINTRNFGCIRSPFYGLLQAKGDAVIFLNSDFQDPPELIPNYIENWEKGHKITLGQKTKTKEIILDGVIKAKSIFLIIFYMVWVKVSDAQKSGISENTPTQMSQLNGTARYSERFEKISVLSIGGTETLRT